jgi:signal transduction histidine kinase
MQPLAQERDLRLQWDNDAPADLVLWADGPRLRQLLVLLLDNAMRYSHPGAEVRLHARLDGDDWVVDVIDQGIGIAEHELPHVFERNYRGERARRHRADGSGLGLPLAQALAVAHGGGVSLRSSAGQGTTVSLRLPWHRGESA